MIFTAYLVMSTTTVYTPGDTHISNMQHWNSWGRTRYR